MTLLPQPSASVEWSQSTPSVTVDPGGALGGPNPTYVMSNGTVQVVWAPRGGQWQIATMTVANKGGSTFLDQPLFEFKHRSDGASELAFPILVPKRRGQNEEKLAFPFGGAAISKNPASSVSTLLGAVDAAALEAVGTPFLGTIPLLELTNPGALWGQWAALYHMDPNYGGLFCQTGDWKGHRKTVGFGARGDGTIMLWRHYGQGVFQRPDVTTTVRSTDFSLASFTELGGNRWRVVFQSGDHLADGRQRLYDGVDGAGEPRWLVQPNNKLRVTIDVELVQDEAVFTASVDFHENRVLTMPYSWRMTYDRPLRLFDICKRYRTWAKGDGPVDTVPAPWGHDENPCSFTRSRKMREACRLHVIMGDFPGDHSLPASLPEFVQTQARFEELIRCYDSQLGAVSAYWGPWHGFRALDVSVEGSAWPEWDPPQDALEAQLAAARALGQDPGVYILPGVYYEAARDAALDQPGDLALVSIDGEVQDTIPPAGFAAGTQVNMNPEQGLEVLLKRWRDVWRCYGVRNIYHDALSGLPSDGWNDHAAAARAPGGSSEVHDGRMAWLHQVLVEQSLGPFRLTDADGSLLTDGTDYLVAPGGGHSEAAWLTDGTDYLVDEQGRRLHDGAVSQALQLTDGTNNLTDGTNDLVAPGKPFAFGSEAFARIENPQERFIKLVQLHGFKSAFVLEFGLLYADQGWRWTYGPESMSVALVENPIARPSASLGATMTDAAADVFVFAHVFQWHAGALLSLNYVSTRGDFAIPPLEGDRNGPEARLYGKIRELATLDMTARVREARMFGTPLRPPAGFFWDAWEDELPEFGGRTVHVDLYQHPTEAVVVLLVSNRDDQNRLVRVRLELDDYPELVGKTELWDAEKTFLTAGGAQLLSEDRLPLTVPGERISSREAGDDFDEILSVAAGQTRAFEIREA